MRKVVFLDRVLEVDGKVPSQKTFDPKRFADLMTAIDSTLHAILADTTKRSDFALLFLGSVDEVISSAGKQKLGMKCDYSVVQKDDLKINFRPYWRIIERAGFKVKFLYISFTSQTGCFLGVKR